MIDRYCRCILFLMCFTFILGWARRILGWAGPTWPPPLLRPCPYPSTMVINVEFACQHCQSWQPEMRLDYSGTKIIRIFIVTNRFSLSWSRCTLNYVEFSDFYVNQSLAGQTIAELTVLEVFSYLVAETKDRNVTKMYCQCQISH
jgi:hypothetical protein